MNCTSARKLLYAFADSQLGVKDNCEVLDHLKMCPECSRIVNEHQSLRVSIGQTFADTKAPEALRASVGRLLAAATPAPDRSDTWRMPRIAGMSLAACIVLAAALFLWRSVDGSGPSTVVVSRGNSAATMIAKVHNECCAHAAEHQSRQLPAALADLAPAISSHYHNQIAALAPDLTASGYRFESANFCGVRGKPGCEGGHLLYVADKPRGRLSFFSVPRWDCLDKCGDRAIPNASGFRQFDVDQDDGTRLSILAWHNDATTYICCGPEPVNKLEDLVRPLRTALGRFDRTEALAYLNSRP
jgi:anti-sigma factor RsiW